MKTQTKNQTLVGEISVTYKTKTRPSIKVEGPEDVADYARSLYPDGEIEFRESVYVIHLNRTMKVLGHTLISIGSPVGCMFDVKSIFQAAILAHAQSIVCVHNHPSGNLTPSTQDIQVTEKIKKAGELLDLHLLDHIIVTQDSYTSILNL